ncbi:MAG: DUF5691 domain-containing protein [Bifidobacteriaceae bacterium]|nr:DUF5691 domain-containing protein [Bifidobacteriaceae bacterium]
MTGQSLTSAYAAMMECWVVGGEARRLAPAAWSELVAAGEPAAQERALAALAAQFDTVALRPGLPSDAVQRPPLPRLAVPQAPQELRGTLRAALAFGPSREAVIRLVARRGFAVHPADWFPGQDDAGVPALYAPWIAWSQTAAEPARAAAPGPEAAASGPPAVPVDAAATSEDWRQMRPAERAAAMRRLRLSDPQASRTRLREQLAHLPAAGRAALVETVAHGLTTDDAELLTELLADRAQPVRATAKALLGRLGVADTSPAAEELATYFTLESEGLLRRGRTVKAARLAKGQSAARRDRLFADLVLPELAAALGLEPDQLVKAWGAAERDSLPSAEAFAELVARSGSDAQVEALAAKLARSKESHAAARSLLARLSLKSAAPVVLALLKASRQDGPDALEAIAAAVDLDLIGSMDVGPFMPTAALVEDLVTGHAGEAATGPRRLAALATMMTPNAAHGVLGHLEYLGVPSSTPALAALTLNARLSDPAKEGIEP